MTRRPPKLADVRKIPAYAVLVRAVHERGAVQQEALAELDRRGLWLSEEQAAQAGIDTGVRLRLDESDRLLLQTVIATYVAAIKGAALRDPALKDRTERRVADCERILGLIRQGAR